MNFKSGTDLDIHNQNSAFFPYLTKSLKVMQMLSLSKELWFFMFLGFYTMHLLLFGCFRTPQTLADAVNGDREEVILCEAL